MKTPDPVFRVLLLGLCLAGLHCLLVAQTDALPQAPAQTQTPFQEVPAIPVVMQANLAEPAAPDSYRLGPGDLVGIFVYQMPDLTRQIRLDATGTITLPMGGQPLPAAGLTAPELAGQIATQLAARQLAVAPQVEVVVRQVVSKPIVVSGAVKYPTTLQAVRPFSLVEVLTRAGGLAPTSGDTALVTTHHDDGPDTTQSFDLGHAMRGDNPAANPILSGNEDVRVLPAGLVYVIGALQKPGGFPIQTGEPITVLKAVALAQGLRDPADTKHVLILHSDASGIRKENRINLTKILKHQVPDIPLLAGDVLYVPESGREKTMDQLAGYIAQAGILAFGYRVGR